MATDSFYLAHIVSRLRADVQFLVDHDLISGSDAAAIQARLPQISSTNTSTTVSSVTPISTPGGGSGHVQTTRTLTTSTVSMPVAIVSMPSPSITGNSVSTPAMNNNIASAIKRSVPPPPPAQQQQQQRQDEPVRLKALWDWTETEDRDLSFKAGDILELVEETNNDWWTGKLNGKQGLFPSNYVERLPPAPSSSPIPSIPTPSATPSSNFSNLNLNAGPTLPHRSSGYFPSPGSSFPNGPTGGGPGQSGYRDLPPYDPPKYNPYGGGPPPNNMHMMPPPPPQQQPVQVVTVQQTPAEEPKKSKFGGLGKTMANSMAGGVGFGAGAAIGGGIINSIF